MATKRRQKAQTELGHLLPEGQAVRHGLQREVAPRLARVAPRAARGARHRPRSAGRRPGEGAEAGAAEGVAAGKDLGMEGRRLHKDGTGIRPVAREQPSKGRVIRAAGREDVEVDGPLKAFGRRGTACVLAYRCHRVG